MSDLEQALKPVADALVDLKWKLEGQKALLIALIASRYGEDTEVFLQVLEVARGQNQIAADHIEEILSSLHIDPETSH